MQTTLVQIRHSIIMLTCSEMFLLDQRRSVISLNTDSAKIIPFFRSFLKDTPITWTGDNDIGRYTYLKQIRLNKFNRIYIFLLSYTIVHTPIMCLQSLYKLYKKFISAKKPALYVFPIIKIVLVVLNIINQKIFHSFFTAQCHYRDIKGARVCLWATTR